MKPNAADAALCTELSCTPEHLLATHTLSRIVSRRLSLTLSKEVQGRNSSDTPTVAELLGQTDGHVFYVNYGVSARHNFEAWRHPALISSKNVKNSRNLFRLSPALISGF